MRINRKLVVWLLTFALLAGIHPAMGVSAAKKVTLSNKKNNDYKGQIIIN